MTALADAVVSDLGAARANLAFVVG